MQTTLKKEIKYRNKEIYQQAFIYLKQSFNSVNNLKFELTSVDCNRYFKTAMLRPDIDCQCFDIFYLIYAQYVLIG